MQTCPSEDSLLDYHFGEIDQTERLLIQTHLPTCEVCGSSMLQFSNVAAQIRDMKVDVANSPYHPGVVVDKNKASDWFGGLWKLVLRPAFVLPTLLMVLGTFGVLIFQNWEAPDQVAKKTEASKSEPAINTPSANGPQEGRTNEDSEVASLSRPMARFDDFRLVELEYNADEGPMLTDIFNEVE